MLLACGAPGRLTVAVVAVGSFGDLREFAITRVQCNERLLINSRTEVRRVHHLDLPIGEECEVTIAPDIAGRGLVSRVRVLRPQQLIVAGFQSVLGEETTYKNHVPRILHFQAPYCGADVVSWVEIRQLGGDRIAHTVEIDDCRAPINGLAIGRYSVTVFANGEPKFVELLTVGVQAAGQEEVLIRPHR